MRNFLIKRLEHKPDLTTGDTRPKVLIEPSIKKEEKIDLTVEIAQEVVEQRAVQRGLDRLLVFLNLYLFEFISFRFLGIRSRIRYSGLCYKRTRQRSSAQVKG